MTRHINRVWFVVVAMILTLLVINPELLSRESIAQLLNQMGSMALIAYLLMSLTRSLLLMPCTPFVLAGAIAFPQWPYLVLVISLAGVVVGAFLVYSFPSFGSYDRLLHEKYPEKITDLKRRMQHKVCILVCCWLVALSSGSYRCCLLCCGNSQDVVTEVA